MGRKRLATVGARVLQWSADRPTAGGCPGAIGVLLPPMLGRSASLLITVLATTVLSSCDGSAACTEIGCDHQAVVTFPAGLVAAAYDIALSFPDGNTLSARCSDPGAPELADNPEGLSCDLGGFELIGDEASARSVVVTITATETGDVLLAPTEVRLEFTDEVRPNGPDCEPVCFVRNGQVTGAAPQ
ncbi:MAG: hypothetical protein AAF721_20425 [Myxococcota bacterium]